MSPSELTRVMGCAVGIVGSYAASIWLTTIVPRALPILARIGYMAAYCCAVAIGVIFWARLLAPIARRREWPMRTCTLMGLITIVPGSALFLANGFTIRTIDLVTFEALFTGFVLVFSVYPNAATIGPFERDAPSTMFPK
jgi:hypothetical protein